MTSADNDRLTQLLRSDLRVFQAYDAVDPPEVLAQRAGIPEDKVIKLNGNENPFGPSPRLTEGLANWPGYHIYPDPLQRRARAALGEYVGLDPKHILAGAGADEIIDLLIRATLEPGDRIVNCVPTFGMYSFSAQVQGGKTISVPRSEDFEVDIDGCLLAIKDGAKVVFICSPNNPSGNTTPAGDIQRLLEQDVLVVVDETYAEFSGETLAPLVPEHWNLVVLRSLSKWGGLAGLRVGYGLMSSGLIDFLMAIKPPYNLSAAGEAGLLISLEDKELLLRRCADIVLERGRMAAALGEFPALKVRPSRGNFLLCHAPSGKGHEVYTGLAERGIFLRYFNQPGLEDSFRISVGLPEHTDALISALRELL
jgi:histidinol-phosphate aminotransferase